MLEIQSKLTSQGQVSIPAAVRSALGVKPGATIRWSIDGNHVSVKRETKYTNEDIHAVLFPDGVLPKPKTLKELKDGIGLYMQEKYARR